MSARLVVVRLSNSPGELGGGFQVCNAEASLQFIETYAFDIDQARPG